MQSVHEEKLSKESAGHSMTLMLYNYLKLESLRTKTDVNDLRETHGELINLIATQILVKKMPLELESITLLLQSIR